MPTTSTPRNRVEQSGAITHDHLVSWVTDGVVKDSGISAVPSSGSSSNSSTVAPTYTTWPGPTSGLTHRWPLDDAHMSGFNAVDVVAGLNAGGTADIVSAPGPSHRLATCRYFNSVRANARSFSLASCPITLLAAWSIGFWLRHNDTEQTPLGGGAKTFFAFNDGTANAIVCYLDGNSANGGIGVYTDAGTLISSGANNVGIIGPSTWAHVCFTFDGGSTYKMYLNGVQYTNTGSGNSGFSTAAVNGIGGYGTSSHTAGVIRGKMAQFVTYSRALTPAEALQLYQADSVLSDLTPAFINITDLGAVGDDSTDCTAAIQQALDAGAGNAITVVIPHGTYKFFPQVTGPISYREGQCLTIGYDNVTIFFMGGTLRQYCAGGANPQTGFDTTTAFNPGFCWRGAGLWVAGPVLTGRANFNVTGWGMLDGQCPRENDLYPQFNLVNPPFTRDTENGHGWDETHHAIFWEAGQLHLDHVIEGIEIGNYRGELMIFQGETARRITVRDCYLHDTNANIDNIDCADHVMEGCHVYNFSQAAEMSTLGAGGMTFRNNFFSTGVTGITLTNQIQPNSATNVGGDVNFGGAYQGSFESRVYGNTFRNIWMGGVRAQEYISNVLIYDNIFYDCGVQSGFSNINAGAVTVALTPLFGSYRRNIFVDHNVFLADTRNFSVAMLCTDGGDGAADKYFRYNSLGRTGHATANGYYVSFGLAAHAKDPLIGTFSWTAQGNDFREVDPLGSGFLFLDGLTGIQHIQLIDNIDGTETPTPFTPLNDGANIQTYCYGGNINTFEVTLADNRTLDNPINPVAGTTYSWLIKQDNVGNRTLAYGAKFKFANGASSTLSTTANAVDKLVCIYDGTNLYCDLLKKYA